MTPAPQRILVVDDLEENLAATHALLRREGAAIDLARSGTAALELLLAHEYAVALVDVQMPEMDGFELARLMRGSERTRHVPIVFVTAGGFGRVLEGYEAGAVDFLAKPIEPHVLRSKVRVFLELDRHRRELAAAATERKRLADEVQAAMHRVAETTALLDGIFEYAPIGLGFVDRQLRYRRVNRALAEMNGLAAEAHFGRRVGEILPGLEGLEALWQRVLDTGEAAVDVEVSGETPATPGERRTWLASYYPVRMGAIALGLGLLVRDVTARKRSDELQRLLVGIVGHDLRNPLSAILTSLQLLGRAEPLTPGQQAIAARMGSACNRMVRLVEDLLDYTRLRSGASLPVDPRPVRLGELLEAVAEEARTASGGGRVRVVGGGGAGEGRWDPERLRQAVGNLVSNALKHGDPAQPVELRWRAAGDRVEIEVANRGEPIPADVLPVLFEPLTQSPDARARGGVGLGLFIAREIVRAHGGDIEVRSGPSETVFCLRLPRAAAASA